MASRRSATTTTLSRRERRRGHGYWKQHFEAMAKAHAQREAEAAQQPAKAEEKARYLEAPIPAPAKSKSEAKRLATQRTPKTENAHPHADLVPDDIRPSAEEPDEPTHDDEGQPEPDPVPLPKKAAPATNGGKLRMTQALRDAQTLSAVLKELLAQGVKTPEGALKACKALQPHVPYLSTIGDLDARVPSKYKVLLEG